MKWSFAAFKKQKMEDVKFCPSFLARVFLVQFKPRVRGRGCCACGASGVLVTPAALLPAAPSTRDPHTGLVLPPTSSLERDAPNQTFLMITQYVCETY